MKFKIIITGKKLIDDLKNAKEDGALVKERNVS